MIAGYFFIILVLTFKPTITTNKETMKKLLFVFVLGAFTACGNGSTTGGNDSTAVTTDTSSASSGTMGTDTSSKMSGDNSKMNSDTGAMSTPH